MFSDNELIHSISLTRADGISTILVEMPIFFAICAVLPRSRSEELLELAPSVSASGSEVILFTLFVFHVSCLIDLVRVAN